MRWLIFLVLHLVAIIAPFLIGGYRFDAAAPHAVPPFPDEWEGRPLTPCPLHMQDAFFRDFPGTIPRFTDGDREFLMRWVTRPTRQLHSSSVCFEAAGYTLTPQPVQRDLRGRSWACFQAQKGNSTLLVHSGIGDGVGKTWYDHSSWYWDASMGKTSGPWLSVTIARHIHKGEASPYGQP